MKLFVVLACALGMTGLASGQTAAGPEKKDPKNPPVKIVPPAAKDAKNDAKADAKKKKEDEIGKVEGMEIARSGGRFLGLQIVDGKFKLNFYDAKKKPLAPDVALVALRWSPNYKGIERVVLTPGGKNSMTAEKIVKPPYLFRLTIVLLKTATPTGGEDAPGETYVVDFRQEPGAN